MAIIFISYVKEDTDCVEQLRKGLESQGYTVWWEPDYPDPQSTLYPRMIENAILRSAALVLVWSDNAAKDEWVERHILFAQQVRKHIVPVLLDSTALPATLVAVSPITSQGSCANTIAQLASVLPAAKSSDQLMVLSAQAAHEFLRERKAALEQAAQMIQQNQHREEVLAIVDYLAHNDLMTGVREKAQEVLNANNGTGESSPLSSSESRHVFGVYCTNGHISYFDKRHVCKATRPELRGQLHRAGKKLDELHLTCHICGIEVVACVDCEAYT